MFEHLLWNYSQMNTTVYYRLDIAIGSGDGLVPPGNKPLPETGPLPETLVNLVCDAAWYHKATIN